MSDSKIIFCGNSKDFLAEELTKASNAENGGTAFRIPSLVNADGTLVAIADKAATGSDWGYIELAVRTSADGGKTWTPIKTIAAPPAREINSSVENTKTAFFIDPCAVVAPNGDVVVLATFFPESKGIHDKKILEPKKIAYADFNGKNCQLIYDRNGKFYYVLDDGTVIDSAKSKTDYTVKGIGELYKGSEYVGNTYLNGEMGKSEDENGKTTFGAPLKAPKRSYVYMLKSSDKGATWSEPVNITGAVYNFEDGAFFAVAPGAGLAVDNRIIMPIYTLKGTVCIYSDDNGATWQRNPQFQYTDNVDEWCAVKAADNKIYAFGRAKKYAATPVTVSEDNGLGWYRTKNAKFKAPKCQKSAVAIGDKIYVAHPSGKKRENGIISVGTLTYNKKGKFKGIVWTKDKDSVKINNGFFAYSSMAKLSDNKIAVLYEDQPSSHIVFDVINL